MLHQSETPHATADRPLGSEGLGEKGPDMASNQPQTDATVSAAENYRQLQRHYDTFLAAYDMLMNHHGIFLLRQAVFDETHPQRAPYHIGEDQAEWITGATYYYAGQLREMLQELERHATEVAQHAAAPAVPVATGDYLTKAWMLSESEQLLLRARLEVRELLARIPAPQQNNVRPGDDLAKKT